jgi:hypothetical protein
MLLPMRGQIIQSRLTSFPRLQGCIEPGIAPEANALPSSLIRSECIEIDLHKSESLIAWEFRHGACSVRGLVYMLAQNALLPPEAPVRNDNSSSAIVPSFTRSA